MAKYIVEWTAEGSYVVEADTSSEATEEALDSLFDLENADQNVIIRSVGQIATQEIKD